MAFNARGLVCDKPTISTSCGKVTEATIQPSLVGTSAVRIMNRKIVRILQDSAAPGRKGVGMQGKWKRNENGSPQNTHIVVQVRTAPAINACSLMPIDDV